MVGYDAGQLDITFSSDCSEGPARQQMITVYPDGYTVITRCDLGLSYIIDPKSRGAGCTTWPTKEDTCTFCACPFCLRDQSGGLWGSLGPGEVTWASDGERSMSPATGEAVLVWRGSQSNGNSIEHAISEATSLPVTQVVSSTAAGYLTIGTLFKDLVDTIPIGVFDAPSICFKSRGTTRALKLVRTTATASTTATITTVATTAATAANATKGHDRRCHVAEHQCGAGRR